MDDCQQCQTVYKNKPIVPDHSSNPPLEFFRELAAHFPLHGTLCDAKRYGSGHINDTFAVSFDQAGIRVRYILQHINQSVFKNVPHLMENISRVIAHLAATMDGTDHRRVLTLIPAHNGSSFYKTQAGEFWRVYTFIEGARAYDQSENLRQTFESARAFGGFQAALADLSGPPLHETIPHFHDTPKRFEALQLAAAADVAGRRKEVLSELDFAFQREAETGRLLNLARAGDIPQRVTHNDTKLNNVMLDDKTGKGICVVDLDTVMPGLSLYDFGELVRFGANAAAEDEPELLKVDVALPAFDAIVQGYIAGVGSILTTAEWDHLIDAAKLMTYENGIRFLTDYLQGDIYFKIRYSNHNLVRARNQLRLVDRMEAAAGAMAAIIRQHRPHNL